MKFIELIVEGLRGVPDAAYSFGDTIGAPRDLVVLAGGASATVVETMAALLDLLGARGPAQHRLCWWGNRRGPREARLSVRWALTEGEAARAGLPGPPAVSEWRFGPGDQLPREILVEGTISRRARVDLAQHVYVNAHEIGVWMEADPLAELLAGIARRDVAATRVAWRQGRGIVVCHTPDTLAMITKAIAPIFPSRGLERTFPAQGEVPVACFREGERVELDQLPDVERNAIHLVASIHASSVRGGVVLATSPDLPAPAEALGRWLDWLAGLAVAHQLQLIVASSRALP